MTGRIRRTAELEHAELIARSSYHGFRFQRMVEDPDASQLSSLAVIIQVLIAAFEWMQGQARLYVGSVVFRYRLEDILRIVHITPSPFHEIN